MPEAAAIEAAAARLRGQVVVTPLVGVLVLPGFTVPDGLRVKLELLQPGGSLRFRGALHALLRRMGSAKGVVVAGTVRWATAAATAAWTLRLPVRAFVSDVVPPEARALLDVVGCRWRELRDEPAAMAAAAEQQREHGDSWLRRDDPDVLTGIATIGLELARELPSDCARVVVAPAELAEPVAAGLQAGGRAADVLALGVDLLDLPLAAAMRAGLRLEPSAAATTALARALAGDLGDAPCALLAE